MKLLVYFSALCLFIECSDGNSTRLQDDFTHLITDENTQTSTDPLNSSYNEWQKIDLDFDDILDSIYCDITYIDKEKSLITSITVYCSSMPEPFYTEGDWDVITNEHNANLFNERLNNHKVEVLYIIQNNELSSIILPGFSYGSGRENFNLLSISQKKITFCDIDVFQHFYFEEYLNNIMIIGSKIQNPIDESQTNAAPLSEIPWNAYRIIDCGLLPDTVATLKLCIHNEF
jgi:hypothetical protein